MGRLGIVAAACAAALVGASAVYDVAHGRQSLLRPPGALPEGGFEARCIKCGRCIEACPHGALFAAPLLAGAAASSPSLDARTGPCHLCEDFPCIAACPTKALAPVASREVVRMGTAVINPDTCLSYKALRCEVCYRACPLIDQAISIDYRQREGDDIHAVFAPVIHEDACVGCGLCVQRCPVNDPGPAITVTPAP